MKETDKERERGGEGESKEGGRQAGRREGKTNDSLLLTHPLSGPAVRAESLDQSVSHRSVRI